MKLNEVKNVATRVIGRTGLKLKKYSPEILMAAGTVSVVAGVAMACKATLHAEEAIDHFNEKMDKVHEAVAVCSPEEYTENDRRRDKTIVYVQTAAEFAKLYAPAIALTTIGITCFFGAYGIIKKRYIGAVLAYEGLQKQFLDYRSRVREKFFDNDKEKESYFYQGIDEANVDEEGMTATLPAGYTPSVYSRFFDETSTQWTRSAYLNKMNLYKWQNWANDMLNSRGHVFLNEVFDMLGIMRCPEGAVVGWVKHGEGDGYIDFGIMNVNRPKCRDFVNGYEPSILLDFNVDGVIFDKI